jgi:hypothetical protein
LTNGPRHEADLPRHTQPAPPAKQRAELPKTSGASTTVPLPQVVSQKSAPRSSRSSASPAKLSRQTAPPRSAATNPRPSRAAGERRFPIPPEPMPREPAGTPVRIARNEMQSELRHARFLIKAGLFPIATDSLRKIIKEVPGTSMAHQAQQSLDSLPKAK